MPLTGDGFFLSLMNLHVLLSDSDPSLCLTVVDSFYYSPLVKSHSISWRTGFLVSSFNLDKPSSLLYRYSRVSCLKVG